MEKKHKFEGFTIHKNWDKEASERIKELIKSKRLSNKLMSSLLDMPLPTFNDKIAAKTSWKLEEIAKLCVLLAVTSDELIFGNAVFITEFYNYHSQELKENIKKFLVKNENFEALGKLTADGFFN